MGMTASLGVGQADKEDKAVEHVIKICANLDSMKLCTVEENKTELEECVHSPIDCKYILNISRFFSKVASSYNQF